ncbi:Crp/Fnr family transcriptional regulator [Maribacter algarum]|uniref:Crp/Fnr family transcriptional regulator n=1 Tax=Maribacter algarum (ex Zhang et al. 2020) TaxID=2578118 RepID=A0A5S3PUB6_9FLAO|nr:Crp/Fnr family transcriptional regulator [Maribacter algarum]TMM57523.1 Crp/Fnr family transcriptional regulator [Maribacter algarum]
MILEDLLLEYGAQRIVLNKSEVLFNEDGRADFYYQISSGEVKMYNITEEGKEFVQGIFGDGKSFGEPPLLGGFNYPAGAIATKLTTLLRITKEQFIALLRENPDIHLAFTGLLCNRLAYKAIIGKEVSIHPPKHRILTILNYLKGKSGAKEFAVDLTRQQIAELTGLRVETVIRSIKKLEAQKILRLENHKIII